MRNIDLDNYIFDYIICNKRILFWRFKDFPRDKDLENHIIDLGETELTQERLLPNATPLQSYILHPFGNTLICLKPY